MDKKHQPVGKLLDCLTDLLKANGYSNTNEVAAELKMRGSELSYYKISMLLNPKMRKENYIGLLDNYLGDMLNLLGLCDSDFLTKSLAIIDGQKATTDIYAPEIREFIDDPSAKEFIEYAYHLYKERQMKKTLLAE